MRAGKLNRKISVRAPAYASRSTDGQPILTFTTVLSSAWCDVQPIEGKELFTADNRYAEVTTRFVLRHSSLTTSITPACIVVESNTTHEYDIKAVIDVGDERRTCEILATRTK